MKKKMGKKEKTAAAGILLIAGLVFGYTEWSSRKTITVLPRNEYGEEEQSFELDVEGLDWDGITVDLTVEQKTYTAIQAHQVYETIMSSMEDRIRKNNESLDQVREDLDLITEVDEYGISIRWDSENPELLNSFGEVSNDSLKEPQEVWISAQFSDGEHHETYDILVRIMPPEYSPLEKARRDFQTWLQQQDSKQKGQEQFILPEEYKGQTVRYRRTDSGGEKGILLVGALLAVLICASSGSQEKEREKKRKQLLLVDYPEIISKLLVFISSGMTIRGSWERIVRDYENGRKKEHIPVRIAYEEMLVSYYQIQSGQPEGKVYLEFGNRCGVQSYLKLGNLLDQNKRSGTKNLRMLLETEMQQALEQRKNLARKLGEEAGTKLLLPLFLMLGVVMVMIVVPAMMSFI